MNHRKKPAPGDGRKRQPSSSSGNSSFHGEIQQQQQRLDASSLCRKIGLEQPRGFAGSSSSNSSLKLPKVYKLTSVIGEGTYGLVQRGVDTRNNRLVAVKQMALDPEDQGLPSVALREITLLGEMSHKNIVNMLDLVLGEKHMMVVFENLDMDLREFQTHYTTKKAKYFSFDMVRRIAYQMLLGLAYIHSCSVIHRDMKPQNVLVDTQTLCVKISDFGLARFVTTPLHEMTVEVVTLWYRAPELLLGSQLYTASTDVWSVGVMIIELLENNCPFDPDSEIRALHMIFEALGTPSADVWLDYPKMRYYCEAFPKWTRKPWKDIAPHAPSVAWNLIEKMLMYEPAARITCSDATAEPMFDRQHGGELRDVDDFKPTRMPSHSPLSPQTPILFEKSRATSSPSGLVNSARAALNVTPNNPAKRPPSRGKSRGGV